MEDYLKQLELHGRLVSFLTKEEKEIIYARWLKTYGEKLKEQLSKEIAAKQAEIDKLTADAKEK